MRTLIAMIVMVGVTGCYMRGHPGAGITPEFASSWNCDAAAIRTAADTMKQKSQADRIPKASWTACDVMASIGNPDSTAIARNGGETVATWCFRNYAGAVVRQVLLVRRDNAWIVDAVTRWNEMSLRSC